MNDSTATIEQLKKVVESFVHERDWEKFHSPKNVSMYITREASELMEPFMSCTEQESWDIVEKKRQAVENELADVLLTLLAFCNRTNIDLATAFENKMKINREKYPADKVRGSAKKYTEY